MNPVNSTQLGLQSYLLSAGMSGSCSCTDLYEGSGASAITEQNTRFTLTNQSGQHMDVSFTLSDWVFKFKPNLERFSVLFHPMTHSRHSDLPSFRLLQRVRG